eukprot:365178-Chlamydomonas_euryale.AAC.2
MGPPQAEQSPRNGCEFNQLPSAPSIRSAAPTTVLTIHGQLRPGDFRVTQLLLDPLHWELKCMPVGHPLCHAGVWVPPTNACHADCPSRPSPPSAIP